MRYLAWMIALSWIMAGCGDSWSYNPGDSDSQAGCSKRVCSDFPSQARAQAIYDGNPSCYAALDSDKDGLACNEPGNLPTSCPTTLHCGCAIYPKEECGFPCCQWVEGDSCWCWNE